MTVVAPVIGRDELVAHVMHGKVQTGDKVLVALKRGTERVTFESTLKVTKDEVSVDYEGNEIALYSTLYNNLTIHSFLFFKYI